MRRRESAGFDFEDEGVYGEEGAPVCELSRSLSVPLLLGDSVDSDIARDSVRHADAVVRDD